MTISAEMLAAIILLVKACTIQEDCSSCPLKSICSKQIQDW